MVGLIDIRINLYQLRTCAHLNEINHGNKTKLSNGKPEATNVFAMATNQVVCTCYFIARYHLDR